MIALPRRPKTTGSGVPAEGHVAEAVETLARRPLAAELDHPRVAAGLPVPAVEVGLRERVREVVGPRLHRGQVAADVLRPVGDPRRGDHDVALPLRAVL